MRITFGNSIRIGFYINMNLHMNWNCTNLALRNNLDKLKVVAGFYNV